MSSVITVMNMKGGVGKTVVASHLAGMLASYEWTGRHRRVLAIDYDPQFNLTQSFLPAKKYFALEKENKTVRAVFLDDDADPNPFVIQTPDSASPPTPQSLCTRIFSDKSAGLLDLLPSTLELMHIAVGQPESKTEVFEKRFTKFIALCRKLYDAIIIDCHPAGSILTKTSLSASDHVIIPVVDSKFAGRGVALMMRFIEAIRDSAQTPTPHVLFNDIRPSTTFEAQIRAEYPDSCLQTPLKHYKVFADPAAGQGFVWSSKRPHSGIAFKNLCSVVQEIAVRLALK